MCMCVCCLQHTRVHFTPRAQTTHDHLCVPQSASTPAHASVPCAGEHLWLWRGLLEVPPEVPASLPGQVSYSPPLYNLSSTENRTEHLPGKCHPSPSPSAVSRLTLSLWHSSPPRPIFTLRVRDGPEWLLQLCKGSKSTLTMAKGGSHHTCQHHSLLTA